MRGAAARIYGDPRLPRKTLQRFNVRTFERKERKMPVARYSAKIDSDGRVRVIHIFLGANEGMVEDLQKKHADGCKAYGPALKEENTIDIDVDVDTLPEADEESLTEFLELDPEDELDGDDEEEDEEEEAEK
jgi:hypothetical protein